MQRNQNMPQSSTLQSSERGKVNRKKSHKSAAQKKREKRKQRRREGSIVSEVSDTESVPSFVLKSELIVLQVVSTIDSAEFVMSRSRSSSSLNTIDTDIDLDDPALSLCPIWLQNMLHDRQKKRKTTQDEGRKKSKDKF